MHTDKISVRAFFFILTVFFLFCPLSPKGSATFFGEAKTGLQNVAEDRYGYSLFVPQEYNPEQKWPLVIALHDEDERGEDYIQTWIDAAKARGMIVFCPTYQVLQGGTPYEHDERLMRLKETIQSQYEIDSSRILIVGFGTGGHYAFYLGLRYPKEFSAIASIGDAVQGSFKKLFSFSYAEVNQLPVLILVSESGPIEKSGDTMAELELFRKKGYQIEVVEAERAEEIKSPTANSYILEWFDQVSRERGERLEGRSWNVKQKFYEWVDQLLQNR